MLAGPPAPMIRLSSGLALALVLLLPAEGRPQERASGSSVITVGSRIRLRAPTLVNGQIEGIVIETDETALLVGINDRVPLRVSRQAITRLDVSTGRHRQALKGAIIGAGIGVASYTVLLAADVESSSKDFAAGAAMGALGGGLWGAGIGALIKSDRWSAVPLDQVRIALVPTRGHGVRLSLSLGF